MGRMQVSVSGAGKPGVVSLTKDGRGRCDDGKYRWVFDRSPELIVILDRKGRILEANGRVQDWTGYSSEEVQGVSFVRLPFLTVKGRATLSKNFLARMMGRYIPPYDVEF